MRRALISSLWAIAVRAGFDFSGCEPGQGSFVQTLPMDRTSIFPLGVLPQYKQTIRVQLTAKNDLDITLYDPSDTSSFPEGKALVGWCAAQAVCNLGLLNSRDPGWAMYKGMNISYSGYDGVVTNGVRQKGNEWIMVSGVLPTNLKIGVLPYNGGTSNVKYSWNGDASDCCAGKARCYGNFTSFIGKSTTQNIGQIPKGVKDLQIFLQSSSKSEDVDVSLYDVAANQIFPIGQAIIGYCYPRPCNLGVLNGANFATTLYNGVLYQYSGYNGYAPDGVTRLRGSEFIKLSGTTNRNLLMAAYGYTSGTASVQYSYLYTPVDYCNTYTTNTSCVANSTCWWRSSKCQNMVRMMQTECINMPTIGMQTECTQCLANTKSADVDKLGCVFSIPLAPLQSCMDAGSSDTTGAPITRTCLQNMCGGTAAGLSACITYFTPYWEQCPPTLNTQVDNCILSAFLNGFVAAKNKLPCSLYPATSYHLCQMCDRSLEGDLSACLLCGSDACADSFYGKSICRRLENSSFIAPCLACAVPASVECLVSVLNGPQVINSCYTQFTTIDTISACLVSSSFCSSALFTYGPVECVGVSGEIFLGCGLTPAASCISDIINQERQYYQIGAVTPINPADVCNLATLSSDQLCAGCSDSLCYSKALVADMCFGVTDAGCLTCNSVNVLQSVYCAARYRATAIVRCFYQQTLTCLASLCNPTDAACYHHISNFAWRCPPSWNNVYFSSDPTVEIINCVASILAGGYTPPS